MSNERKHHAPQEKVAVLRRHLIDKVPVPTLCDEHQLHPTVFYRRLKLVGQTFAPLVIVCRSCCVHRVYFWVPEQWLRAYAKNRGGTQTAGTSALLASSNDRPPCHEDSRRAAAEFGSLPQTATLHFTLNQDRPTAGSAQLSPG